MPKVKRDKSVAERISTAREKMGRSQFEVAIAAGLRPETLSRIEGGAKPSKTSLEKLARVLELDLATLGKQLEKE